MILFCTLITKNIFTSNVSTTLNMFLGKCKETFRTERNTAGDGGCVGLGCPPLHQVFISKKYVNLLYNIIKSFLETRLLWWPS